jgi:ABC-2 type transport system permease protein
VKAPATPGFWLVATRELRFFRRDKAGLFLLIAVPLSAFAILAWTFSSAVVRGLNVVVVDQDRSDTSSKFVEEIGAAPGVRIARRADALTAATRAIRSGDAMGAVYIPPEFEKDLLAGRRPQIVAFYNTQYYTPGNITAKALRDAISAASGDIAPINQVRVQPVGSGPLVVEQYVLTNPAVNYAAFLLRAVMPTVLHVVIAIATGYSS